MRLGEALRTIERVNRLVAAGEYERAEREMEQLPMWAVNLAIVLTYLEGLGRWLIQGRGKR